MIQKDPADRESNHSSADSKSGQNEIGMIIHDATSLSPRCAARKDKRRNRRRKISLRMAIKCSVTNNKLAATAMINKGQSMEE
jgi:hypothetical protein